MKKIILITGGSDGVGKALAENLSDIYQVVILSKDKEKTEIVAKEIGADFVVADVTKSEEVREAVKKIIDKYQKIDVLVNNAGLWTQGLIEESEDSVIKDILDVNTYGTILMTKYVVPHMKKEKVGKIINVISQAGLYGKAERSIYNTSKWAISGFTKSIELELSKFGISVNGFYPGAIKTDIFKKTGNDRNMDNYMEKDDVVRVLRFIIETKSNLNFPEIGVKSIE